MKITINGRPKDMAAGTKLHHLIEQFCRDTGRVIAEVNGTIVKSASWADTGLKEGDQVELVTFVGGG